MILKQFAQEEYWLYIRYDDSTIFLYDERFYSYWANQLLGVLAVMSSSMVVNWGCEGYTPAYIWAGFISNLLF